MNTDQRRLASSRLIDINDLVGKTIAAAIGGHSCGEDVSIGFTDGTWIRFTVGGWESSYVEVERDASLTEHEMVALGYMSSDEQLALDAEREQQREAAAAQQEREM